MTQTQQQGRVRLNPLVLDIQRNWKQYGFASAREARLYTAWVARQGYAAHLSDGDPLPDVGYNGLVSTADVLRRYPIDEYQADKDIRTGSTRRFANVEEAVAYLKSLPSVK